MRFLRFEPHGRFHGSRPHPLPPDLPTIGFGFLIVVVCVGVVSIGWPTWMQSRNRYPGTGTGVFPAYPAAALEQGIEGDVLARFRVRREGTVASFEVLESMPPGVFDESVRNAVEAARFGLAIRTGGREARPLADDVEITQRFEFRLKPTRRGEFLGRAMYSDRVVYGWPDTSPVLVTRVEPDLPPGLVAPSPNPDDVRRRLYLVTFRLSREGRVTFARIGRSPGHREWNRNVLRAIREWRYQPATRNGRPVPVTMTETVILPYEVPLQQIVLPNDEPPDDIEPIPVIPPDGIEPIPVIPPDDTVARR
jgi:TonB family protein